MKKICILLLSTCLLISTTLFANDKKKESDTKKTTTKPKSKKKVVSKNKHKGEGSIDLSSEIQDSVFEAKKAEKEIRPRKNSPKAKRTKQILRVSGTTETVQVPDSVEWDHNRKKQDKQIQNLNKQMDKEPNQSHMGEE